MNRLNCRHFIVFAVLSALVGACASAPATTSSSPATMAATTNTPLPTSTLAPTVTLAPTATVPPTATPKPLCGAAAVAPEASTATLGQLAKYEPPDGQVYFGFTYRLWGDGMSTADGQAWGDTRPFATRICDSVQSELAGKTPTIIKIWSPWKSNDGKLQSFGAALKDIRMVQGVLGSTVVPMVEWQAGDSGVSTSSLALTNDIASGKYDDYITQYAKDIKAYGRPLFVRLICGEFNGNFWQWCSPKANSALTADDFVNAWRHVVDIFHKEEVSNVAWIWTPLAPLPKSAGDWGWDSNWQAYYPGDGYVDWVGADLNNWGKPSWLDPVYQFGIDHKKPFFLAEFAIRHLDVKLTHAQDVNWLNSMFDYVAAHADIKAISYFNYKIMPDPNPNSADHVFLDDHQVNYLPNANDFDQRLIAGGPDVQALFSTRISDPRFISTLAGNP